MQQCNFFDEYVENFDEFKDIAKKIANEIEDDEIIDFIGDDTSYASAYLHPQNLLNV